MTWKNPRIGMVAQALLEGETACPVILLDEIDKAFRLSGDADPLGPLHALMEPETARNFPDEFLEMPVAADDVIWISTANSVDNVAPSILDRHLILEIAAPDRDQMSAVIGSIYRTARSGYGAWFDPQLSAVVTARLVSIHPRRVKRLLCLACTRAASMGRQELAVADIEAVLAITSPAKAQGRIGFLS